MAEGWQRGEGRATPGPQEHSRLLHPQPQGAKFAWEGAGSGLEVCPEAIYGTQEIHVSGAWCWPSSCTTTTQVRATHAPRATLHAA